MYCPNTTKPFYLSGNFNSENQVFVLMKLYFCQTQLNSDCDFASSLSYIRNQSDNQIASSQMYVYILDKSIYPAR
jgi:hypothetical protein